jgi:error-prone DNA polymerase
VRAHQAAKAAGLKLIVGSEIPPRRSARPWGRRLKLVFLACNRAGYGNLSALITLARRRAEKGATPAAAPRSGGRDFAERRVPDCLVLWVPGRRAT